MKTKVEKLTVNEVVNLLCNLVKNGQIKGTDEVWLSSDEEGNSFHPLVKINGQYNVCIEQQSHDKNMLVLMP
jgi:hypothetical protein